MYIHTFLMRGGHCAKKACHMPEYDKCIGTLYSLYMCIMFQYMCYIYILVFLHSGGGRGGREGEGPP